MIPTQTARTARSSNADFKSEPLTVLLGPDAPGLSAATIRRLVSAWQEEHQRWQGRDLAAKRYVDVWADGIYFAPRLEHARQCLLVPIGADASGKKELLAIDDGFRESEQSWWVPKTANVLNYLPKSVQNKAKADLHAIDEAASRAAADAAFDRRLAKYQAKYEKAVHCLAKDREALLAFYDFPAEPWKHVRSTNPVESTFATVRLRTAKTTGCLSRATALAMASSSPSRPNATGAD